LKPSAHKTAQQSHPFLWIVFPLSSTGKEKDEEKGYDYFGARYILQLKSHWA